jgi:two-component system cell cycle response regulator DivK
MGVSGSVRIALIRYDNTAVYSTELRVRNIKALALHHDSRISNEKLAGCILATRLAIRAASLGAGAQGTQTMPKTVLIVEDNELNMKLFHDLLQANGFDTIETRNGIEALDLARKHKPDLILMDIQLPEVSGLEVTKWIKEDDELRSIPVIAVTAFAMKGDEERIREGGCEAYLSKPISVAKFLETVRHFVKQDGAS